MITAGARPKNIMRCWALVSTAFVAIVMAGGAERPAVRTFDLFTQGMWRLLLLVKYRRSHNACVMALSMKKFSLAAIAATSLVIAGPAYAGRDDFGMGAASVACAMLDSGYSRYQVEKVLNRLERDIINSGITERQQSQMASGFNYQAARNNCSLRYRE